MIITCSKCGEKLNLTEYLFEVKPEDALVELLFAHLARIYRQEFSVAYAAEGEEDIKALNLLMQSRKDEEGRINPEMINEITEAWSGYLRKNGSAGTAREFVYSSLSDENGDSSRVIPFRPRS